MRAALTKASLNSSTQLDQQWYGKNYSDHVDDQIEQLALRGDGRGLRLSIDAGLLERRRSGDISERRCQALISYVKSPRAVDRKQVVERWIRELLQSEPTHALTVFLKLARRGESITATSKTGWNDIGDEIKAALSGGIQLDQPLPARLKVRETTNFPGINLEHCSVLGLIFSATPAAVFSKLVQDGAITFDDIRKIPCGSLRQSNKNECLIERASLLDVALHSKGCHDKLNFILQEVHPATQAGKVELAASLERLSRTVAPLDRDDILKVASVLNDNPDFSLSSAVLPLMRWSKTAILHDLCMLDNAARTKGTAEIQGGGDSAMHAAKTLLSLRKESGHMLFDPNTRNSSGETALHVASTGDSAKMCLLLLAAGADHSALTPDGLTPYDIATKHGNQKIITLLAGVHAKHEIDKLTAHSSSLSMRR